MCRRIDCRKCGRPTFAGCGAHVEQVLGDVPVSERCQCREAEERAHQREARRSGVVRAAGTTGLRARVKSLLGG